MVKMVKVETSSKKMEKGVKVGKIWWNMVKAAKIAYGLH